MAMSAQRETGQQQRRGRPLQRGDVDAEQGQLEASGRRALSAEKNGASKCREGVNPGATEGASWGLEQGAGGGQAGDSQKTVGWHSKKFGF